jgi:RNA polymerase sigma factor (sigma-70 family)
MEDWAVELRQERTDPAWDLFIARYRRLIFASIRHYAQDYDDVMDIFARVCEALREDDCRRLRAWTGQSEHRARFSTWLVTVVRHLTVDWFRHRDGRRRLSTLASGLPAIQQQIVACVFTEGRSHREAYELIRARESPTLSFRDFRRQLRAAYQALSRSRHGVVLRDAFGAAVSLEEAEVELGDDAWLPDEVSREQVAQALSVLAPAERVAVQLYVLDELPAADVARIVGLKGPKAVYNLVYRALAAMRAHLEQSGVRREDS